MKGLAIASAVLAATTLSAHAQTVREPTFTPPLLINGRVLDANSGQAIRNARVTTTPSPQGTRVVLTDPEGHFALPPPPGRYAVTVTKTGYAPHEEIPTSTAEPLEIHLTRGVVIAGRVADEFGDPVAGARVAAFAHGQPTRESVVATTYTDDRGDYRLSGLRATPLGVVVTTVGASATTYYPGVTEQKDAQQLHVQPGEERLGVDFVVRPDPRSFAAPLGFAGMVTLGTTFRVVTSGSAFRPPSEQAPDLHATGIVRGRITTIDGRPVSHARVLLFSPGSIGSSPGERAPRISSRPSRETMSDDDGRYEFRETPAGTLRITATKAGYSPVEPGGSVSFEPRVAPAGGELIELANGQSRRRVDITLARWGTVMGRLYDEYGDPVQGASVQVLQVRYEAGRRWLVGAGMTPLTDDRGQYRVFGLAPGQYIVSAVVGGVTSVDLPGYTRSYFPGTPNAEEAQFVTVGLSQDVGPVDLSLERAPTARIAGRLVNAAGEPAGGSLSLMPSQRSASATGVPVGARIEKDGSFEFPNVAPGRYVIKAEGGRSNAWTEGDWAAMAVTVNGADVTDLRLQTSTGSTIKGRIMFDTFDQSQTPSPSAVELFPVPVDLDASPSSVARARIHADWTFEMSGINGPRRLELLRVPSGWSLQEVRVNGVDVTDQPLAFGRIDQSQTDVTVVLSDRITALTGTVADDRGRPALGSAAIVFPVDRARWYPKSRFLRKVDIGDRGFNVDGLPPGDYYVAAVARVPVDGEDAWQEPAFLESLRGRASAVTLRERQKATVTLRSPARR